MPYVEKREAEYKSALRLMMRQQLPGFVITRHADAGDPDWAVTGFNKTSFLEFKHGTPSFESPANQELMCMRLANAGFCRYVIWQENANGQGQRTMIVHPREVHRRQGWNLVPETFCVGYDLEFIVKYLRKVHGVS